MMSHPVTVTPCDTVLRASRHIRPPIRGGVYVTRDQRRGRLEGRGRNTARHTQLRVESRNRPNIGSPLTLGLSPRRPRQLSTRQSIPQTQCRHVTPGYAVTPAFAAFPAIDPMIVDHGEGIYARVAAASFTLVDGKMGARDRSRNLEMARYLREGGLRTRGWVGVAGNPGCLGIIDVLCLSRGASENFGRPSQKTHVYK
jgi:hypothetical protein